MAWFACLLAGLVFGREALARNRKARRGGADTGTIEDTRLYSVWDDGQSTGLGRRGGKRGLDGGTGVLR
ncbi:hypothetical protein ACJ41O_009486 [Fusarium nematophilum]